jgi:hypothetical protein
MDRSGRTFAPGSHSHDAMLGVERLACLLTEISALGQELGASHDVSRRVRLLRRFVEAQREWIGLFEAHRRASRDAFEALLCASARAPVPAPANPAAAPARRKARAKAPTPSLRAPRAP